MEYTAHNSVCHAKQSGSGIYELRVRGKKRSGYCVGNGTWEVDRDPAFKCEYDRLAPRYAVISEMIATRIKKGVTQKELAKRVGTTQSSIARLEGGMLGGGLAYTFTDFGWNFIEYFNK